MVGLGLLLLIAAIVVEIGVRRRPPVYPVVLILVGVVGALVAPGGVTPRRSTTVPRCAATPAAPGGRLLVLDGLRHSYVDVDDPDLPGVLLREGARRGGRRQLRAGRVTGRLPRRRRRGHLPALPRRHPARHPQPGLGDRPGRGRPRHRAARAGDRAGPAGQGRGRPPRRTTSARLQSRPRRRRRLRRRERAVAPDHHRVRRGAAPRAPRRKGCTPSTSSTTDPLGFARAELATLRRVFDHVALAADAVHPLRQRRRQPGRDRVGLTDRQGGRRARLRRSSTWPGTSSTATGSPSGSTGRRCSPTTTRRWTSC